MMERGYPAQSFDQQVADLSVEHAGTLDSYREAHALATRSPERQSTEDLRRAIVGYRQLFVDIVGVTPGAATAAQTQAPADVDLRDRPDVDAPVVPTTTEDTVDARSGRGGTGSPRPDRLEPGSRGGEHDMGIGISIFLIAVGAILAFAVHETVNGIDLQTVGWILMVVGVIGVVLFLAVFMPRRRSYTRETTYGGAAPVAGPTPATTETVTTDGVDRSY